MLDKIFFIIIDILPFEFLTSLDVVFFYLKLKRILSVTFCKGRILVIFCRLTESLDLRNQYLKERFFYRYSHVHPQQFLSQGQISISTVHLQLFLQRAPVFPAIWFSWIQMDMVWKAITKNHYKISARLITVELFQKIFKPTNLIYLLLHLTFHKHPCSFFVFEIISIFHQLTQRKVQLACWKEGTIIILDES